MKSMFGFDDDGRADMLLSFSGLLFDLDGTLVDSSDVITRTWCKFGEKYQIDIMAVLPSMQGMPGRDAIKLLRPDASEQSIEDDAKWLEGLEANDTDGVVALPGARELLNLLNEKQIPWAIVTSGTYPIASGRIKAANLPFPAVLITPELINNGKPHPEPYLLGAQKLGLEASQCIVFEDASAGITSGTSAGATVIGILTEFDRTQLLASGATACIDSMLSVGVESNTQLRLDLPQEKC